MGRAGQAGRAEDGRRRGAERTALRAAVGLLAAAAVLLSGCASRSDVVRELRGGSESATLSGSAPAAVAVAGPYRIEVREFEWRDASRARAVPGRLYLPLGASGAPLVVFSNEVTPLIWARVRLLPVSSA